MPQFFGHETRVLACMSCGAPLEAMAAGGAVRCRYCGATNLLAARMERAPLPVTRSQTVDDAQRMERLRQQSGEPGHVPASVRALLAEDGSLPAWKVQEAIAVWQSARAEVAEVGGFDAAERLLFLTTLLGQHYRQQGEPLRQRAMLESALEVFGLPRHAQIVRGQLARSAVRAGEIEAAAHWLAPCDAHSDNLQTDSAYRHARGLIDTARGDARAVLAVLGDEAGQVPLVAEVEPAAALLRAQAWESLGQDDRAEAELVLALGRGQRATVELLRGELPGRTLCERSYPAARREHRSASADAMLRSHGAGVARGLLWLAALFGVIAALLVGGGGLCLLIALVSAVAPALAGGGEAAWFAGGTVAFSLAVTGFSLIGPGAGMALTAAIPGFIGRRIRSRSRGIAALLRDGEEHVAEIVSATPTGGTVDGAATYRITVRVALSDLPPVETSMVAPLVPARADQLRPGSRLPILLDPADPKKVWLER